MPDITPETARFLALRGWLRLVVGSCSWCATRQAIAQVEAEAKRKHEAPKDPACSKAGYRYCDAGARAFWPSMPRPGETATEKEIAPCPKCGARAWLVQVGQREVLVCPACYEANAGRI